MKKIHILAAVLLLLMLCTACSGSVKVVGSWTAPALELQKENNETTPVEQIWTFGEDGSGSKVTKGLSDGSELQLDFTYTLTEDQLTLQFADEKEPEQHYTVRGNAKGLTLTSGSQQLKLEKYEK